MAEPAVTGRAVAPGSGAPEPVVTGWRIAFAFAISVGLLVGVRLYSFAAIALFVAAIATVLLLRPSTLVDYYLVAGAITFPDLFEKIAGAVSLTWMRTTILGVLYCLYVALLWGRRGDALRGRAPRVFVLLGFAWIAYLGVSILWSPAKIDALRYYPKYVMTAGLALALLIDRDVTVERALRLLTVGAWLFIVVSLAAAPFKSVLWPDHTWVYFEGISGRHQSKYFLVFTAIYGLASWLAAPRRGHYLVIVIASVGLLAWILQRGAFLALLVGATTAVALSPARKAVPLWLRVALAAGIVGAFLVIVFATQRFQDYMFNPGRTSADFFGAVLHGDVVGALAMVQFRGRLEYWAAAFNRFGVSLLGAGYGATASSIASAFGEYNELHNDWLQYFLETGLVGFALYITMWVTLFFLGWRRRLAADEYSLRLALTVCGYTTAIMAWSFVDHVFDYAHMGIIFLFAATALLLVRERELRDVT